MNTYDVPVTFTIRAVNAFRAEAFIATMLHQIGKYDQLPDWVVNGASVVPDEVYMGRLTKGETDPLTIAD